MDHFDDLSNREYARNELKRGGDTEKAAVWAMLCIAESLGDIASSIEELKQGMITVELTGEVEVTNKGANRA